MFVPGCACVCGCGCVIVRAAKKQIHKARPNKKRKKLFFIF